jgi:carbon storage regulator
MLILTRRAGETVQIGDDVAVTVVAIKGHQVRIGVKAPRSVTVDREEIFGRKRSELASRLPDTSADGLHPVGLAVPDAADEP